MPSAQSSDLTAGSLHHLFLFQIVSLSSADAKSCGNCGGKHASQQKCETLSWSYESVECWSVILHVLLFFSRPSFIIYKYLFIFIHVNCADRYGQYRSAHHIIQFSYAFTPEPVHHLDDFSVFLSKWSSEQASIVFWGSWVQLFRQTMRHAVRQQIRLLYFWV